MADLAPELTAALAAFRRSDRMLTVVTGAGISAESGIPTFRGPEGYWQVGSENYTPQEIGTLAMYRREPEEVWKWYLFRRSVCREAAPNAGHQALVTLEQAFGDRFRLITQNVDGLHLRAGNTPERTYLVHGSLEYMRCGTPCSPTLIPFPDAVPEKTRESPFTDADRALLACPACGDLCRPHVLWFDECYDEEHYRFQSSLAAAEQTGLLITVGTSGGTNLPHHVVRIAAQVRALLVDVNLEPNPFSEAAERARGRFLQGPSSEFLPALAAALTG